MRTRSFLEQRATTQSVLERVGARNVRLMGSIGGGEAGALAVSMEFDDYASYGKFTDAMLADSGRVGGADLDRCRRESHRLVPTTVWSVIDA